MSNDVYISYASMTMDEAERKYWTFYEIVSFTGRHVVK